MDRTLRETLYYKIRSKKVSLEELTPEEIAILRTDHGHDWRFKWGFELCHRDINENIIPVLVNVTIASSISSRSFKRRSKSSSLVMSSR